MTARQYDILRHIHAGKLDKDYPDAHVRRVLSYLKHKYGLTRIEWVLAFERGLLRVRRPMGREFDNTDNTFQAYLARRG